MASGIKTDSNEPSIHVLCNRLSTIYGNMIQANISLHVIMYGHHENVKADSTELVPTMSSLSGALETIVEIEAILVDIHSKLRVIESEK